MHIYIAKKFKKHTNNTFQKKNNPDFKELNQRKIKICYLFD